MSLSYGRRLLESVVNGDTEERIDGFICYSNADVNYSDEDGLTPLMAAARVGRCSVISLLVGNSANIEQPNRHGETALFVAASRGQTRAIEILVSLGADVNITDIDGLTSLAVAASNGHTATVELLANLRGGSTLLNQTDNYGNFPIKMAASNGHVDTVRSLVKLSPKTRALRTLRETLAFLDDKRNVKCNGAASIRFQQGLLYFLRICRRCLYCIIIQHFYLAFYRYRICDICIALSSLKLPIYVILWIVDWIDGWSDVADSKRINCIDTLRQSIGKWKKNKSLK